MSDTDIVDLAEAKAELNITVDTYDTILSRWITAISELVDAACGPVVVRTVTAEAHNGGGSVLFLRQYPVLSVTTVTEYASGTPTTLTAEALDTAGTFRFDANLGTVTRRSSWNNYPFAASGVLVTYKAGSFVLSELV